MFQNLTEIEQFLAFRKSLGIKPGLERMRTLLKKAGNPERKISAIHIAGTNGKGSTVQFLKNALQSNGYSTGVFTSPSLEGVLGHIYHDDSQVEESIFVELCNQMYPAVKQLDRDGMSPTEFEIITALAFMYFSKHVDIALIEAGMGGRMDTTNCFDPLLSIITNISIDHTKFLGSTISEIAYHKAGIIKRNKPVIVGEVTKDAFIEIEKEAQYMQASFYRAGQDFTYRKIGNIEEKQRFLWNETVEIEISMSGEHQIRNAAVAFMAVMLLKKFNYTLDMNKTLQAFLSTKAPGRFELIQKKPTVILDGAHNTKGAESFIDTVLADYKDRKRHLIFAVFKDKKMEAMLKLLVPHFSSVTLTAFDHPRAASLEDLKRFSNAGNILLTDDWKEALTKINDIHAIYFVTGSLEFISRVRKYFLS